jgi:hypothetical protein
LSAAAENTKKWRSAIDGRTTRHAGYAISPRVRKPIAEASGWANTAAGMCKARHGRLPKMDWPLALALAAYPLVCPPKLLEAYG